MAYVTDEQRSPGAF